MSSDILHLAGELLRRGEAFVLATVVWRRGPSSGKLGSKAIVLPDGTVRGWLGGACAEPTVVREALSALTDGRPRLMALGPAEEFKDRAGVVSVPMACDSEGALEVYLEPMLPAPQVVAIGRSPAVDMLARFAAALGWRAVVVDDGGRADAHPEVPRVVTTLDLHEVGVDERTFVVVATQGHYDEQALQAALATEAGYVGLVASRKRADGVLEYLRSRGVSEEALARVRAPAGVDLGPVEHEEMAVAILAELVALKTTGAMVSGVEVKMPEQAVDPVCGMTVDVDTAHYTSEHEGTTYYFCAAGCQRAFEADPESFLAGDA